VAVDSRRCPAVRIDFSLTAFGLGLKFLNADFNGPDSGFI
jgi:hypothetical protein